MTNFARAGGSASSPTITPMRPCGSVDGTVRIRVSPSTLTLSATPPPAPTPPPTLIGSPNAPVRASIGKACTGGPGVTATTPPAPAAIAEAGAGRSTMSGLLSAGFAITARELRAAPGTAPDSGGPISEPSRFISAGAVTGALALADVRQSDSLVADLLKKSNRTAGLQPCESLAPVPTR